MASRETFTDGEWQELQCRIMLAGSHITASDWPGQEKSSRAADGGSRFLAMMQTDDNRLIADLAGDRARTGPPEIDDRSALAGDAAIDRIRSAVQLVAARAPEDLEAFTLLLTGIAEVVAEEVDGVSTREAEAMARIRSAIDSAIDQ